MMSPDHPDRYSASMRELADRIARREIDAPGFEEIPEMCWHRLLRSSLIHEAYRIGARDGRLEADRG
jgi:hypothetical protein